VTGKTRTDKIIDWIKNNKVLSVVIAMGLIIIAIGTFAGALGNIKNLLFPSKPPTPVVTVQFPDQEPKKCAFDNLPQKPFEHENSTKILIAVFEGGRAEAEEFGIDISMSIADRLDEYSKDSLHLSTEDIEVYRLDCYVQNHSEAREILDSLGADVFVWGNNFCVPGSEEAKFCPKATLTRRISTLEAGGERIEVKEQLAITDLDLPALTAERPYQLLSFIFGLHFYLRDKFKDPAVYFEKAGDEIYSSEKGVEYIYHYLAYTYQFLSKYEKALSYYEKSLRIFEDAKDRKMEGMALNNIGMVYMAWGEYNQAIEYFKKSLKITREVGDRQGEGVTLNNIGGVYDSWGKYDQAIEYYKESMKITEEVGDRQGEGVTLGNIGLVYKAWGKYDQAIECYKKSLKISREVGNRQGQGVTLSNIGLVYHAWGQYDQAIEYYKKSLKIREEVGHRQGEGVTLNNIGGVYDSWGKYDQAIEHYKKSLKILEEIGAVEAKTVRENLKVLQGKMKK